MPYRDEIGALRAREEALARELDAARQLRTAAERRALPVLEALRVASPCPEKWEDMIGDGAVRFCGRCAKNVYDLSSMTREEAEHFVKTREGPVCVTMRRRRDGTVITNDCPVGARRRRFGVGVIALAIAGAAAAFMLVPYAASAPLRRSPTRAPRPLRQASSVPADRALDSDTLLTGTVAQPPRSSSSRTTGCLCQPGDPLCSCM